MSLATLGAVSATTNELPLPDTSALSLGEALILSGGGGTTEAVVIRSIASGRNIGVTVNRGALGTLQLAHAAPTTVTIYDPSGGGGGGGVTVDNGTDPPAAVTTLVAPGADVSVPGQVTLPLIMSLVQVPLVFDDFTWQTGGKDVVLLHAGQFILDIWVTTEVAFNSNSTPTGEIFAGAGFTSVLAGITLGVPVTSDGVSRPVSPSLVRASITSGEMIPLAITGANVQLTFYGDSGTPYGATAGASTINVLIATPAS